MLHKAQLADIEPAAGGRSTKFSVKVSQDTVDLRELASLAKITGSAMHDKRVSGVGKLLDAYTFFFQFGPRTGAPVYNDVYALYVPEMVVQKCPNGHVTDLISLRETHAYPVVKGEIVRVDGVCVQ